MTASYPPSRPISPRGPLPYVGMGRGLPELVPARQRRRDAGTARTASRRAAARRESLGSGRALTDLLDRLVDSGAVVSGDVIIGLAGVDLIRLDLRLLLIGAQSAIEVGAGADLRPRADEVGPVREVAGSEIVDGEVVPRAGAPAWTGGGAER